MCIQFLLYRGEKGGNMETTVLEAAFSQGIWAVLAIFLLIYVIKENEKCDQKQEAREEKYQSLLSELTDKFAMINEIKKDINDIKELLTSSNNEI